MYLSLFKILRKVVNKIVRLQRNFLWGCNEGDKKIAWVSWDSIRKLRKHGGLGVKNIAVFNRA